MTDKYDPQTGELLAPPEDFGAKVGDDMEGNIGGLDRSQTKVQRNGAGRIVGYILFGGLIISLVGFILFSGEDTATNAPQTTKEEIVFRAPEPQREPVILSEPVETPTTVTLEAPAPQVVVDPALERERLAQQERDLERKRAELAEMYERLAAPQLVIDNNISSNHSTPTSQINAAYAPQPSGAPSSSLAAGSDTSQSDREFMARNTSSTFPTVSATQLKNLDTLIAQGKMISGILETAVHSSLPGMVRAITSENVYSFDGSTLLIPKGARLVGQYRSNAKQGQARVFVIWNRMIRPDGASIDLGSIGTDGLGRSGVAGDVDTHFMERFGASVLLSIIDGAIDTASSAASDNSGSDVTVGGGGGSLSKSSEIALENSINIQPTIQIDQGSRIKIFVGKDLDFKGVGGVPVSQLRAR